MAEGYTNITEKTMNVKMKWQALFRRYGEITILMAIAPIHLLACCAVRI